jgi:hypothetical protein
MDHTFMHTSVTGKLFLHLHIQGGSNMTGTVHVLFTHKSVPVIFESPCTINLYALTHFYDDFYDGYFH